MSITLPDADNKPYRLISELTVYPPVDRGDALSAWKLHSLSRGDQPREFLTPRIECVLAEAEFPFMSHPQMPAAWIQAEMDRLAPWTYHAAVPGATTLGRGTYNEGTIRFHRYRSALISATVARLLGDEIGERDLLDLGCNCGVFTLDMADRGVRSALGVDFRPENLVQAEFLKAAFGIANAQFQQVNVKQLDAEAFDVVFNLGLMYHLSTPFEIMKACYDVTRLFCVVDTVTHCEPFSGYHVAIKNSDIVIEGDLNFELQPTYRGILDTIRAAGFKEIVEIYAPTDVELYNDGSRRCLIAFKAPSAPYLARLV